jgi:tetratricopeptide (TPR) repeat protein
MEVAREKWLTVYFLALALLPHKPGRADFSVPETILNATPPQPQLATARPARIFAFQDNTPEIVLDLGARVPLAQPLLPLDCRRLGRACGNLRRGFLQEAVLELEARRADGAARLALAEVRIIMGQDETARRELESLAGRTELESQRAALEAIIKLRSGRPTESLFFRLRHRPGTAALSHCAIGHIRLLEGRYQQALTLYAEAQRLEVKLSYRFNQAAAHLLAGRARTAGKLIEQLLPAAPRFSEGYLLLGLAELSQAHPESAVAALLRAEELGAQYPDLHYAIGTASEAAGLHQLAATYLEKALAADPENEEMRDQLVVSLVHAGNKEMAARVLIESPVLRAEDPQGHFLLGLKLLLCEQPRAASQVLLRAVSLGKRDADTFFALGQALLLDEHAQEAVLALEIAARLAPRREEIRFMLALALAQDNRTEEALARLRQAADGAATDRDALGLRMELSLQNGDLQGCIDDARRLLRINPALLEARFHLALCLAESGDLDAALSQMRIAVQADHEGQVTARTLRLLKRLLEERTAVAGWYLLLAQIHRWRGDWSEAVLSLEKFLLLAPTPRWSRLGAGMLYELTSGRR